MPLTLRTDRLELRLAREADVPALLDMMADFNHLEGIAWSPERGEAPLRRLLQREDLGLVGLFELGHPPHGAAGYFVLTWGYDLEWDGRDAFLTELYLLEAVRGLGLGRQALAAIEALARRHDARALHLMVRIDNSPALRLYRGAGYESPPRIFLSKPLEP